MTSLASMKNDNGAPFAMSDILGMALSGENIFIHYIHSKPRLAVVKISPNGQPNLNPAVVDVDANMKLVPVFNNGGNGGIALVSLVSCGRNKLDLLVFTKYVPPLSTKSSC